MVKEEYERKIIVPNDWKGKNRGIKYDSPFINIHKVPREMLKTEGKP